MKTTINYSILLVMLIFAGIYDVNATYINVSGTGKISGNIRNATSDLPLANITITLFSTADSSMVVGTISDIFGNFCISMLDSGRYYLVVSENGFEKTQISQIKILSGNPKINVGEVMLNPVCEIRRKHKK